MPTCRPAPRKKKRYIRRSVTHGLGRMPAAEDRRRTHSRRPPGGSDAKIAKQFRRIGGKYETKPPRPTSRSSEAQTGGGLRLSESRHGRGHPRGHSADGHYPVAGHLDPRDVVLLD